VNQLDGLRRYLEAATTLTQITRGRAEELVRDLVASGELERTRAQEWIEDLLKRSREASEILLATISAEVDRQLGERGFKNLDLDDLAQRVAGIIELAGAVGRNVSVPRVWSRGPDDQSQTAKDVSNGTANHDSGDRGSGHKGSDFKESGHKESGHKEKAKSGSGKKKDGSVKSGAKDKKSDAKKSEAKKSGSQKTEAGKTEVWTESSVAPSAYASTPPASTPVIAEATTEHPDHGATT
jgi:polyhydroxyalkanoate synthesis regulator phasin